jgi:ribosomal-protein-alanine N-acetyltransferase
MSAGGASLPVVTPLTVADLDEVMALERRCFPDEPWTRRMYIEDLTRNELATYLAVRPPHPPRPLSCEERGWDASPFPGREGGQGVRSVLAWGGIWMMADEAHIATVASHPDFRGCGLGLWIMLALLEAASARGARLSTLEVRADNIAAQQLYLKLGYEIAGRRKRYYRDAGDGLIMTTPALARPAMQVRLAAARAEAQARLARCF